MVEAEAEEDEDRLQVAKHEKIEKIF